jgi:DNA-binding response OmpR family regulator
MKPPVILLATTDPNFEEAAVDAIIDNGFGVRRVRGVRDACHRLSDGANDIALAVIDLEGKGLTLLHILGGCEPGFPILAVADRQEIFRSDEMISGVALGRLLKPVTFEQLRDKIGSLVRSRATASTAVSWVRNARPARSTGRNRVETFW